MTNVAVTSILPILRVRKHWREILEIVGPVAALGLWYKFGQVPAQSICHVLLLMSPALAGRMLIARVTDQDQLGPDRFLQIAIYLSAPLTVTLGASAGVQAVVLGLVLAYAIVHVFLDFIVTVRRLGDHLRPGELLAFARLWPPS
jgi:hypothetical protein